MPEKLSEQSLSGRAGRKQQELHPALIAELNYVQIDAQ